MCNALVLTPHGTEAQGHAHVPCLRTRTYSHTSAPLHVYTHACVQVCVGGGMYVCLCVCVYVPDPYPLLEGTSRGHTRRDCQQLQPCNPASGFDSTSMRHLHGISFLSVQTRRPSHRRSSHPHLLSARSRTPSPCLLPLHCRHPDVCASHARACLCSSPASHVPPRPCVNGIRTNGIAVTQKANGIPPHPFV